MVVSSSRGHKSEELRYGRKPNSQLSGEEAKTNIGKPVLAKRVQEKNIEIVMVVFCSTKTLST